MAALNNLSPDQLRTAKEQMRGMNPETLQQQAASYSNHLKGEQTYKINASKQLKAEGNALHSSGNYAAAMAKYERALDNLQRMNIHTCTKISVAL
jgi:tetratricopeptide (TPR) repeat protein